MFVLSLCVGLQVLTPLLALTAFFYYHFASKYAKTVETKVLAREVASRVDKIKGRCALAAFFGPHK